MHSEITKLRKWLILINVAVSVFMATLDGSIVNIALNKISENLKVSIGSIQWVVTAYLLTISLLLLIWGKLSDLYGKKKIFAFGFIIFTLGSLLCGLSNSLNMLVFSRIIQAVGAASMMALSQGIITRIFPPNERGKALGITGTTVAIGSLAGPSIGGILVQAAGWQSIFLINIPIGIIGTILTLVILPEMKDDTGSKSFDVKGMIMFTLAILLMFMGLLFLQEGTISIQVMLPMLITSFILIWRFIEFEKKVSNPLINLDLFKIPEFSMGLGAGFLCFIALNATILFMPFYLQLVLKMNPLEAGVVISFYPLTSAVVSPLSGWLSDKISFRPLTVAGLTLSTVLLFILATVNENTSYVHLALIMSLLGAGGAIFQSPNNSSIMGSVPKQQLGIAGGINALFRNLGMVTGTTLSVLIFSFSTKMNFSSLSGKALTDSSLFLRGFEIVTVFAGLVSLLAVLVSLRRAFKVRPKRGKDLITEE